MPVREVKQSDPSSLPADSVPVTPSASVVQARPFAATTVWIHGTPSGLRMVESSGSRLTLYAAPYEQVAQPRACIDPSWFGVYVLADPSPNTDQEIYIGSGTRERKWGDQFDTINEATQVYVLTADTETLDKVTAPYVEARLIQICNDLDLRLLNSKRPYGGRLRVWPQPEQLVGQAEALLHIAGFVSIDQARRSPPAMPRRLSVTADLNELVVISETEAISAERDGQPRRLVWRDLQAVGYVWNDRFYVMMGADYARKTRNLSHDHRERRKLMEAAKWVAPTSGKHDKMAVGFHCCSGAFAAKVLTGEHIDNDDAWKAIEATTAEETQNCEVPA